MGNELSDGEYCEEPNEIEKGLFLLHSSENFTTYVGFSNNDELENLEKIDIVMDKKDIMGNCLLCNENEDEDDLKVLYQSPSEDTDNTDKEFLIKKRPRPKASKPIRIPHHRSLPGCGRY